MKVRASIEIRHLGKEDATLCGKMGSRDVVDNQRPGCEKCVRLWFESVGDALGQLAKFARPTKAGE